MDITKKIDGFLNEGKGLKIAFNTRPFENSHGKKPSGRGVGRFRLMVN